MKYVLDTNVISEITKSTPRSNVVDWIQDHNEDVYITSVSIEELYYGVFLLPEGRRKTDLRDTIDAIVKNRANTTFTFDAFCGYLCARNHAKAHKTGRRASVEDCMIASICQRNDAVLVTRNIKDFNYLDLDLVNPFDYESETLEELKRREAGRDS